MIICCGEALMDMIPVAMPDGSTAFTPNTGGAVFNTAVALGRLGAPVAMISGVLRDEFGEELAETLVANHVETALLVRSDLLTALAVVHLDKGQATYGFYDEGSAGRMIVASDLPKLPENTTALYFGGISLVSQPAADAYCDLCVKAAGRFPVMIDPNIRPDFITDAAAYRARLDRMLKQADIVKVSDEDLAWITGGVGSLAEQATTLQSKGPRFVIVTRGAEGVMALCSDRVIHVAAEPATVVDTVGAGDTFNAGFLAYLAQQDRLDKAALVQMPLEELRGALAYGARVAAVTVSRSGANPPWLHEL